MKKKNITKGIHFEKRCLRWLKKLGYESFKTNISVDQIKKIDIIAVKLEKTLFIQVKSVSWLNLKDNNIRNHEEKIIIEFVKQKQKEIDLKNVCMKIIPYYLLVSKTRIYFLKLNSWRY